MTTHSFISPTYRRGHKLALFTFLLAFVVIVLGGYTRLTDAGLSCPDWPHCYGYLTAPHTPQQLQIATQSYPSNPVDIKKAWTEMTHRYFAGTEGILILILAGGILFARRQQNKKSAGIALLLMGLLFIQVALGMLTVTKQLKPIIVLSHLLTGLSILSVLWWAYLSLYFREYSAFKERTSPKLMPWLWVGLFIISAQITLGGWVSTHYAGLACVDFPYCNGTFLPTLHLSQFNTDLITIHMLHRIGAAITALYISLLVIRLSKEPLFRKAAMIFMSLIVIQITLGILNIIWLRPVWVALAHQGVAILLLLSIIATLVKASATMDPH